MPASATVLISNYEQIELPFESGIDWAAAFVDEDNRGPKPKKFIIDSFSDQITISLGRECDCDIAYDIPQQLTIDEPLLKGIRNLGFRWVYVDNRRINKDMVTMAHNLGLKVMAYTVAQKDTMSLLHAAGVDGVISDIYLDHSLSH